MHAHPFPKTVRVRSPADFARAFAAGRRAGGRSFRGVFLERSGETGTANAGTARLGMAITRKVNRRAVERNRIRRLIREWFRHRHAQWRPGDLVISGKPEASGVAAAQLFADLDAIARRLGLKDTPSPLTMADPSPTSPHRDVP